MPAQPDAATSSLTPPAPTLLVEGSAVALQMLERVLRTAVHVPLELIVSYSAQDVSVELAPVRLALIDIDTDDAAATALIKRLPTTCWRVATTLYDEEERLLPALQLGIHGYLLKQDRYERQVEGLQRILRGMPELSPALARSVLAGLQQTGAMDPQVEQVLDALGRGRSIREAARTLKLSLRDVQGVVARAYSLTRHWTTAGARPL